MPQTTTQAAALQRRIRRYLLETGRDGDVDRMAQRIALEHARGSRVVGFRRDGRELFVREADGANGRCTLAIDEVTRDGRLNRTAVVWRGRDLDRWLAENHHYREWLAPDWRSDRPV